MPNDIIVYIDTNFSVILRCKSDEKSARSSKNNWKICINVYNNI